MTPSARLIVSSSRRDWNHDVESDETENELIDEATRDVVGLGGVEDLMHASLDAANDDGRRGVDTDRAHNHSLTIFYSRDSGLNADVVSEVFVGMNFSNQSRFRMRRSRTRRGSRTPWGWPG